MREGIFWASHTFQVRHAGDIEPALYFFVPGNLLWLHAALNALFVAGLALLVWSESGYVGERAETLRAALEARRERRSDRTQGGGEGLSPQNRGDRLFRRVAAAFDRRDPQPCVAARLPSILDPSPASELPGTTSEAAPPALATDSELPGASGEAAPPALATDSELPGASGEAAPPDAAAQAQDELASLPFNPFNAVARIVFVPFLSLYSLLINHLMVLYILFVPLSFFLPAFALAGYLQGPRLRAKKLMAIKKGIRAKKRKERRERRSSGPKPEV